MKENKNSICLILAVAATLFFILQPPIDFPDPIIGAFWVVMNFGFMRVFWWLGDQFMATF